VDRNLADETYKFARTFMEWKSLTEIPNPQIDEVTMAWKRLMIQEDIVRKMLDGEEPCEDCPDENP
jgi:hypothetical protein